jgi:hypothetical protein
VKLTPCQRDALKLRVLAVAQEAIAAGVIPSEKRLRDAIPDFNPTFLTQLRDELRQEGKLPSWSHLWRPGFCEAPGLTGETQEERKEIEAAIEAERARKIAAGPERESSGWTEHELTLRRQRVHRDPHGSRRREPSVCSPHGQRTGE